MDSSKVKPLSVGVGLASLAWFLLRVIPKPSRAAYPCQRAAAPFASGFVVWIVGLIGARALHRRAASLGTQGRCAVALTALTLAVGLVWLPLGVPVDSSAEEAFVPSDQPNQPVGAGKGINPGRVAWIRDPGAARWDGKTGEWWDEANTNQASVDQMVSRCLQSVVGRRSDKQAWDALFRNFNQTRKLGKAGYKPGEKVVIKLNQNQDRPPAWRSGQGMPSPQMVYALAYQLIKVAGVPGKDIVIYDASRYVGDPIYTKLRGNADPEFQAIRFVVSPKLAGSGRVEASPDMANPIHFAQADLPVAYPPTCVTEAKYLINFALLRPHTMFGVTLTAKNHFGSTYFPDKGGWTPAPLHNAGAKTRAVGTYNCLIDLMGHRHLGGKTLLYMLDGLYPAEHQGGKVMRFQSFDDGWVSSLFLSQDPVAIDSVGLDFLRNEPKATQVRGNPDNYLHEAALANKPPSGTVYDPEHDGKPLDSLGVHEHWNNPAAKQYSRNLGKAEGIELVSLPVPQEGAKVASR